MPVVTKDIPIRRQALLPLMELRPGHLTAAMGTHKVRTSFILSGKRSMNDEEFRAFAKLAMARLRELFTGRR